MPKLKELFRGRNHKLETLRKEKQEHFFKLYLELGTLEKVAAIKNITRERVRQILANYGPYIDKQRYRRSSSYKEFCCQNCHRSFIKRWANPRFCSRQCYLIYTAKQRIIAFRTNAPKLCKKCHVVKPSSEFYVSSAYYKNSKGKIVRYHRLNSSCKWCQRAASERWRQNNLEKVKKIAYNAAKRRMERIYKNPKLHEAYLKEARAKYHAKKANASQPTTPPNNTNGG